MSIWSTTHEITIPNYDKYGTILESRSHVAVDIATSPNMSNVMRLTIGLPFRREQIDLYISPDNAREIAIALNSAAEQYETTT